MHNRYRCGVGRYFSAVAKTEEEVSTADQLPGADAAGALYRYEGAPVPLKKNQGHFLLRFWRSAVGKKWVMAVTGIMLLGFVLVHMIGNLKVFLGEEHLNTYAEWLRDLGEPAFPRTVVLWALRLGLLAAVFLHIIAAAQLTRMNHKARPVKYQAPRDYVAANFASRSMRWTGIIVALFVIFHLADLTWGSANPHFVRGDPYNNLFNSFERVPVAIAYIAAMIAISIHIFHGAWAMFNSLGLNNPRYNDWKRAFAAGFALVILVGNVSMPLLIVTGAVTR
jgi:succinate dehydrogenase / fumarate reductase cytochrome b subunit